MGQLIIGHDIFSEVEDYNHDDHYDYAKDKEGNLYKCRYGNDGDGDWYITYYEPVEKGRNSECLREELVHYKLTGRLPLDYKKSGEQISEMGG